MVMGPEVPPEEKGGGGSDDTGGLTEAQVKYLGGMVNQIVTSHLKRQPTIADQLKDFKWDEVLTPVVQKLVPSPNPGSEDKGGKKPELDEYQKQLAKLAEDVKNSEKSRIDAENRAKASETARRVDAGKLKLRSALTGHVNDGALDHVINHLTVVSNRLVVDDDGNAKLRVKRPEFPGMPPMDIEVSVDDAIKDILSESDMKIFLPAPGGKGGSNPGPGGKTVHSSQFSGVATTDAEKIFRAQTRENELKAKYGIQ